MPQIQNQDPKTAFEDTGKKSFNFFLIFRIEVASTLFLLEIVCIWVDEVTEVISIAEIIACSSLLWPLFLCIHLCYLNWCNQIRNPTWLLLQRVAKLVIGQGLFGQVRVLLTCSMYSLPWFDIAYFLHEIQQEDEK